MIESPDSTHQEKWNVTHSVIEKIINGNKSMKDKLYGPIVRHKQDNVHVPSVQHELLRDFILTATKKRNYMQTCNRENFN